MIAPMDRITVVGRRSAARDVLQALQSLGVVHVDPLEPGDAVDLRRHRLEGKDRDDLDRWTAVVQRLAGVADVLSTHECAPAPRSEGPTRLDDIETFVADVGTKVDALVSERAQARDELATVEEALPVFRVLGPIQAPVDEAHFLAASAFLAPADVLADVTPTLADAMGGALHLSDRAYGDQRLVLAVTLRSRSDDLRRALARVGLAPLDAPSRYAGMDVAKAVHIMDERSRQLPKRLAAVDQQLEKLAEQHGPRIEALRIVADNLQQRLARLEDLATGRYAFALQGWVPSADARKVEEGLAKQFGGDLVIERRAADEHHDVGVPTKLDNPAWMRPFQGLLALFAPPKYGNFDPTWTLATLFPLYFGIVVGDIAYGAIFLALGLWLQKRGRAGNSLSLGPVGITLSASNLPAIGTVVNWCAGWSIAWGVVYGEFWGNFLEYWPKGSPVFYTPLHSTDGIVPILLFRVEQFNPLLMLTLGFGVAQVLFGWAIRVYYGVKHHDKKHTWEGIGMFAGLLGVVVFAVAFLGSDGGALPPSAMILSAALMVVFAAGVVLSGIPLMLVELISNAGNILSYLRLFAVGLSAALVANLGTAAGFATNEAIPVPLLGELIGISVAVLINGLAVILTIVGHTLQPLRLQYVEFFTKFGFYESSGRPYTPFRLTGGKA